jgi:aminopeptidase N
MKLNHLIAILLVTVSFSACQSHKQAAYKTPLNEELIPSKDYHSYANTDEVVITHITLDLEVSFDEKVIHGRNHIFYSKIKPGAKTLVLDSKNLKIHKVLTIDENSKESKIKWRYGRFNKILGNEVIIDLPSDETQAIIIEYDTSPNATGLQWLTKEQTRSKKHPFLYSQSQAIHARTWIPLQDTPQVRQTYSATVKVDRKLRAVMSASNNPDATEMFSTYRFSMSQQIPSYLIALAVGNLEYKKISFRSGVWAEPDIITAATLEFDDTELMIQAIEKMYGKYAWETYDLLILPASFPIGGMENPRLSFITPTVIAGDKSLTSLIAHELAHSWSGNLVTNATWRDLWLNEGFTSYLEGRITEVVNGKDRRDMEAVLSYQSLLSEINELLDEDQQLAIDLRNRDPDEAFSDIPYEKGRLFLEWLENRFGRSKFDYFLEQYFEEFAFQSLTTETFLSYLEKNLLNVYTNRVTIQEVNQWVYQAGIPENAIIASTNKFELVKSQSQKWQSEQIKTSELKTTDWTTQEWLYFLNNLASDLKPSLFIELDNTYKLSDIKNTEIAHSWYLQSIKKNYQPAFTKLEEYLLTIGRNKLIAPLYEELVKTKAHKDWALKVYKQARSGYHLTIQANIDLIFK